MKTLVFQGKDQIGVETRPIPTLAEEEVLIRVKYAGICGTDLSIVAGLHPRAQPSLVMGHEFSGVIEELNTSQRSDLKLGDRVVVEPLISCGHCFTCKSGLAYVCQNLGLYGIDTDGAFAEYIKVAADKVYKIPDSMSFEIGTLIEPVATAVHSVRLSSTQIADTVCVLGGGPIGLLTALIASEIGLRNLILCEIQPYRLQLAKDFGIRTINPTESDPVEEVMRMTEGRGADVVFEVAGAEESILLAPKLCRVRGEIVQIAMPKVLRPMDIVGLTFRELTLKGVRVYAPYDFERSIALVAKSKYDFGKFLSSPFLLEEGEVAFQKAKEAKDAMKVLFAIE